MRLSLPACAPLTVGMDLNISNGYGIVALPDWFEEIDPVGRFALAGVAQALFGLLVSFEVEVVNTIAITRAASLEEIAVPAGLSCNQASHALERLRARALISARRQRFIILEPAVLTEIAAGWQPGAKD